MTAAWLLSLAVSVYGSPARYSDDRGRAFCAMLAAVAVLTTSCAAP